MAKGDCFVVAYESVVTPGSAEDIQLLLGLPPYIGERSALRLCHGLPRGQSGPLDGLRHWHAWVELTLPDEPPSVIDMSNDRQIRTTQEVYYKTGRMTDEHVWRWTPKEARRTALILQTYGPWVFNWMQMEEVNFGDTVPHPLR